MSKMRMNLLEHLEELRGRLLISILMVSVCSVLVYHHAQTIFHWLAAPVGTLVFLAPAEAFLTRLKIALWGGFFLSLPVILFQAWRFVVTGLTHKERKALFWVLPSSYLLFFSGAALALFLVIPTATRFLLAYGSQELQPFLGVGAYVRFVLFLTVSFGTLFQLPLVLFFLRWLGVVTPFQLASYRRHVYLGSFIVSAVLTPGPDVFSQMLLAVPTILLFEISLGAMKWAGPVTSVLEGASIVTP